MNRVFLNTDDDVKIVGNYVETTGNKAVLLLHRLNMDKSDYDLFAQKLKRIGFSSLALDFRGHGESGRNWKEFSDDDFRNMKLDAKAGVDFLKDNGKIEIFVVGESIGANTALIVLKEYDVKKAVLLSPGMNYRGIDVSRAAKNVSKPVLVVVAKDDPYFDTGKKVADLVGKEIKIYEKGGHGTQLFSSTDLMEFLLDWL